MVMLGGGMAGNRIAKLFFTIMSAVAEAERDLTRERIAERDQRKRNRYLAGTPPFGWQVGKDEVQQGGGRSTEVQQKGHVHGGEGRRITL